ncbi:hypothetical protein ACPCSK_31495 [Streptomyces griseoincarnatus]
MPGAGKSTFAGLLAQELDSRGVPSTRVKLAQPLYDIQAAVYEKAGRPLADRYQQDGELLNFLGSHMKKLNPRALLDAFVALVHDRERDRPGDVLICDDMRGDAAETLVVLGFTLIEVSAFNAVRRERKQGRKDLSAGNDRHSTEVPVRRVPDHRVINDGSLEELRAKAADLVGELLR